MAVNGQLGQAATGDGLDHPIDWPVSRTYLKLALGFIIAGSGAYLAGLLALTEGQGLRAMLAVAYSALAVIAWLLLARGRTRAAVWFLGGGVWCCMTVAAFYLGGVGSTPIIIYPMIILLAGWMVSVRAAAVTASLTLAATLGMVLAESRGWLPAPPETLPLMRWFVQGCTFVLTAFLIISLVRAYRERQVELQALGNALRQRAAELEASTSDLHRAQAVAHVGSWVYDLAGDVMRLSAETCRIFGLPEGTTGSHAAYLSRVHAEDRGAVAEAWRAALAGGAMFDSEHRIMVGQRVAWVRQVAEFHRNPAGMAERAIGTTHDITERKRHEAEVAAARRQLDATLAAIPDLLFEVGLDGRHHACHSPDSELLAAPAEQLIGRTVTETLPPAAAATVMAALLEANLHGNSHGKTFELQLPQGTRWFELSVSRKPGTGESEPRFIALSRDITKRKNAEAEVAKLNATLEARVRERTADLETANQELESFSYTVSHDLRGPLRSMVGFAGLISENLSDKLDHENRDYLDRITASGNKMSRLIDGVLDYSRLSREAVTRRPVDLDALVREIALELRDRYPRGELVLNPLGMVHADPVMMRQILHNLLDNAFKYSARRERPRVEVGVERVGDAPEYVVRDNGIGFDMRHADHLFKLFTRLHNDPAFDSTGAGLAIVKRLIDRHGGSIRAEAQPDRGATFRFTV